MSDHLSKTGIEGPLAANSVNHTLHRIQQLLGDKATTTDSSLIHELNTGQSVCVLLELG